MEVFPKVYNLKQLLCILKYIKTIYFWDRKAQFSAMITPVFMAHRCCSALYSPALGPVIVQISIKNVPVIIL